MQDRPEKVAEELATLQARCEMWQNLFRWFIHDINHAVSYLDAGTLLFARSGNRTGNNLTSEDIAKNVARMEESAKYCRELIQTAYIIAFPERFKDKGTKQCILAPILNEASNSISIRWAQSQKTIVIDDSLLNSPPIYASRELMYQFFCHLFLFSISIAEANQRILVSRSQEPNELLIRIVTSEEISEEDVRCIWISPERFFRGNIPRSRHFFHLHDAFAITTALIIGEQQNYKIIPIFNSSHDLVIRVSFDKSARIQDDSNNR